MLRGFYSDAAGHDAAYALLRRAVGEVYGMPMPAVAKTPSGKPFFPRRPDIHFSLSHGKSRVLVVIGDEICGCDAENFRPLGEKLLRRISSPEERETFSPLELWVLKESFIKFADAPGTPMSEAVFTRRGEAVLPPAPADSARLYRLDCGVAAVVCTGYPPEELIFVPAGTTDT